jgi:hypothetical protein
MFVAALLGAALAARDTSTPAQTHHHEIVVAKGNSRDALAREQMLIRQMLTTCARWIASPARAPRLGSSRRSLRGVSRTPAPSRPPG